MTWNQDRERIIAAAELGDAPAKTAVALLVDARKRAYDAVRESEAQKTAAIRLREDLVERTSERDAAREEVKTLRHNLMAITAQEQERTDQLALAESACRRDALFQARPNEPTTQTTEATPRHAAKAAHRLGLQRGRCNPTRP